MESLSMLFSTYELGIIYFSKPSILLIIMYYLFIYLFLYNYKYCFIFFFMLLHKFMIYLNPSIDITFLDVGQGDSTFIKMPYNKGNILIDTGGEIEKENS